MKSRLADTARRSLQEDVRRMTPEQRLVAFLEHCQFVAQLHAAGRRAREACDARQSLLDEGFMAEIRTLDSTRVYVTESYSGTIYRVN